ncbi:hypothetical protein Tco_1274811 [Tanacetum coccineum]
MDDLLSNVVQKDDVDKMYACLTSQHDETIWFLDVQKAPFSSPKSSQIQELTNQVLILQSQKHKLELEKKKAEVALLKAQPSFPNFNELTEEVKGLKQQVHELEIELPRDLKEIPSKLEDFTKTVTSLTSQIAELKILKWELPAEFVSLPVQVLDSASLKAGDQSVPSAGQADTMPAEGEKNTNQATIS